MKRKEGEGAKRAARTYCAVIMTRKAANVTTVHDPELMFSFFDKLLGFQTLTYSLECLRDKY